MKTLLSDSVKLSGAAIGGVAFIAVAVLMIAALAHFIPREGVVKNVYASMVTMDHFKRADSFTECLVIGSAIIDPGFQKDVFGFEKFARVDEPCPVLNDYLASQDRPSFKTLGYTRYWNGPVVLSRALFSFLDFMGVYIVYAVLSLTAFALWGFALMKVGVNRNLSIASTLLILWGGGFVFFGGNIAHAPAFFLPLFMLGHATLKTRWWENEMEGAFLAASLGALTMWLDMLFEAVPFNALLLGLSALLLTRTDNLRRLVILLSAFGLGVAAMIAFKLGAIAAFDGMDAIRTEYFEPLQLRMGTESNTANIHYWDLLVHHLPADASKIYGNVIVYWAYTAMAAISFILAIVKKRANLLGFALLMAVVPVWYALFLQHSWVHSGFSTQLLFWPAALALIALAQDAKAFKIQNSTKEPR